MGGAHNPHRDWAGGDDLLGHGAKQQVAQAAPAMGCHNNKVGSVVVGSRQNRLGGVAWNDEAKTWWEVRSGGPVTRHRCRRQAKGVGGQVVEIGGGLVGVVPRGADEQQLGAATVGKIGGGGESVFTER